MQRTSALFICLILTGGAIPILQVEPAAATADEPRPVTQFADGGLAGGLAERGEAIFRASCQTCHGDKGQGVEDSGTEPLVGDLTPRELTEVIIDTMPEEDPESCVGEDAAAVAVYLHETFYGLAAQQRNRPPRIAMARLTGQQLRQSLADLYGYFGSDPWTVEDRGVGASYYEGSQRKNDKKKIERVDREIDFDFADQGPGEGIDPKEYRVHWSGSLKVDRGGRYEIILRSSCSCLMSFGDDDRELINNHVQSEGKEEFRRTLQLTAGRAYPFEIDFIQRKRKTEQPPARISLSWIPPGGIEEIIPERHLLPQQLPSAFSLQAKLPPDDRSYGYDRGTTIDRQWDDSTTAAAIEFAQITIDELYRQYRRRHRRDPDEDRAKLRAFLAEMVEVAFRGPVDETTRKLYIDGQISLTEDDAEAIKRVLLLVLKSPRFLYPMVDSDRSQSQRVANRLALVLFDSIPSDDWLIKAGRTGRLETDQQITQAATKMVRDYRAQAKTRALLYEWFDISQMESISKDSEAYPGFDDALIAELKQSLDAFFDEVVWSESSDFRQLLQADWMFTSDRFEKYFGESWRAAEGDQSAGLRRSVSDAKAHVGALTHPLLMSNLAYHKTSSPIHRGVFLTNHLLGRVMRPPQAAFTPINPDLHPHLTTRQRVELQTGDVNCQVCHEKINALGFALENFDATGRFRTTERDKAIDAAGSYVARDDTTATFNGARELGDYLATSPDCHRAFVETAFEHFVKQSIAAYGPETANRLTESFRDSGYNIQQLMVSIATIACENLPKPNPET
jgi:mono/diheme cytochrome c family protein